jgi:hypothetical protein
MRNVRPFYGPEGVKNSSYLGYYMEYVLLDAEAFAMINFIKQGQFIENRFVAAF